MNSKARCNNCKEYFPKDLIKKMGGSQFCSEDCIQAKQEKMQEKAKNNTVKIKQKSTTNKNTSASFSVETKKKILERDVSCILCPEQGMDFHHVYFSQQCEYGKDRNNVDKGVLLCRLCHGKCHSCKSGEGEREKCINYLEEHYV